MSLARLRVEEECVPDLLGPRQPRTGYRVSLIGLMGTGKTTIGQQLAKRLGSHFIDSDKVLEARTRRSVSELFALEGEAAFRRLEADLVDEVTAQPDIVLSTGGGAILHPATRTLLKVRTTVFHLTATIDEIHRRTQHDTGRPLLRTADPIGTLRALYEHRAPLYADCAHRSIDTTGKDIGAIVADIAQHLEAISGNL